MKDSNHMENRTLPQNHENIVKFEVYFIPRELKAALEKFI